VVQLYASAPDSAVVRAPQWLVGFARVAVPAGERRRVAVTVRARDLATFDEDRDDFVVEPISYTLRAARHAGDEKAPAVRVRVSG
jgi:hypothetical protein